MSEAELIDTIMERYGIQAQALQLSEEVSELTIAISHRLRGRTSSNSEIKEEIADVTFMLRQMIHFFDISQEEIETIIQSKEQRMIERLKGAK